MHWIIIMYLDLNMNYSSCFLSPYFKQMNYQTRKPDGTFSWTQSFAVWLEASKVVREISDLIITESGVLNVFWGRLVAEGSVCFLWKVISIGHGWLFLKCLSYFHCDFSCTRHVPLLFYYLFHLRSRFKPSTPIRGFHILGSFEPKVRFGPWGLMRNYGGNGFS